MKKILLLFISLFIGFTTIAQDRFQRIYEAGITSDVLLDNDGTYFVRSGSSSILHIDAEGKILESTSIPVTASGLTSLKFTNESSILTDDKCLVLSYLDLERDSSSWFLGKFNFDGNKIWELSFLLNYSVSSYHPNFPRFDEHPISKLDNNHLLLCEPVGTEYANLFKVSSDGELIWQKRINADIQPSFSYQRNINVLDENNFILYHRQDVIGFNGDGDSLWHIKVPNGIRTRGLYNEENKIVYAARKSIEAVDTLGNLIWEYQLPENVLNINPLTDDTYIVSVQNDSSAFQYLFNETTGTLMPKEYSYLISNIIHLDDNDIVATGGYGTNTFFNGIFLKTDFSLEFDKEVNLLKPNGGEKFNFVGVDYFRNNRIWWLQEDVSEVNIYYSLDNGANWHLIIKNYSDPNDEYVWLPPVVFSQNVLIKIEDASDPSIFDISDKPFEIEYSNETDYIAANECKMWIGNMGMSEHDPIDDDSGFLWPGGENAIIPAVFAGGILWGGIVNGAVNVNGATYRYGLIPGVILENGERDDENKPEYSIYKLKKNWQNIPDGQEKDIMQYSYDNWPAQHGAPYTDVNGDGRFTRGIDEPKIIGDETLFYVANDLDTLRTEFTYGSPPIGLEFQQTLYAYNTNELKDVVFKKVTLINKSNSTISDMYLSYWADDDLGNAGDDYVGCDSTLSLSYTWNGDNFDDNNYGEAPPAVGRVLLQGPLVQSKYDTAYVDGNKHVDYKNIPMTAFFPYLKDTFTQDPDLGIYNGSLQMYNNMKGINWQNKPLINPLTVDTTTFFCSGDPESGTGWYEGLDVPPYDRRSLMSSGPFEMQPGDIQSVVFAIVMARGSSNVNSVTKLKEKARELHEWWGNDISVSVKNDIEILPDSYSLSQNYPNPFNPSTTIAYNIPVVDVPSQPDRQAGGVEGPNVRLVIYDILGREVATLVNEKQKPGSYRVEWDATSVSRRIASGIYFYRITIGNFSKTQKMMLLK